MTKLACHCEARSNLSFICLPALDNRDRHVPRDDITLRCARDDTIGLSLRACEAISLFCLPSLDNRDRHTQRAHCATLAMTQLACHCEPAKQSLFSVCLLRKGEIATYLAMTDRAVRACEAISLLGLPAMKNRDRRATLAMTQLACHCEARSNLAFRFARPGQPRSPRPSR